MKLKLKIIIFEFKELNLKYFISIKKTKCNFILNRNIRKYKS